MFFITLFQVKHTKIEKTTLSITQKEFTKNSLFSKWHYTFFPILSHLTLPLRSTDFQMRQTLPTI